MRVGLSIRNARWFWAVPLVVVVGLLANAFTLAQSSQPLPGLLVGVGLSIGFAVWYGRWILTPTTVQVGPTQLTILPTEAGGSGETLPFSHLSYCSYTTYRARLLQVYRKDGTRIRLRARGGVADLDALAELLQRRLGGSLPLSGRS